MSKDLIKSGGSAIVSILKDMIKPEEVVKQITRKTTVKTDTAIHTVWEVAKKTGVATFKNTKKL